MFFTFLEFYSLGDSAMHVDLDETALHGVFEQLEAEAAEKRRQAQREEEEKRERHRHALHSTESIRGANATYKVASGAVMSMWGGASASNSMADVDVTEASKAGMVVKEATKAETAHEAAPENGAENELANADGGLVLIDNGSEKCRANDEVARAASWSSSSDASDAQEDIQGGCLSCFSPKPKTPKGNSGKRVV